MSRADSPISPAAGRQEPQSRTAARPGLIRPDSGPEVGPTLTAATSQADQPNLGSQAKPAGCSEAADERDAGREPGKTRGKGGTAATDRPARKQRERNCDKRKRKLKRALATWPLAKQVLNDSSNFGDCEDISSAHLTGRLIKLDEPTTAASLMTSATTSDAATATTIAASAEATHEPACLASSRSQSSAGLGGQAFPHQRVRCKPQPFITAADELGSAALPSNYNHRRPFAEPFERPAAGWLYNATATPPLKGCAKLLFSSGANLKGKCVSAYAGCPIKFRALVLLRAAIVIERDLNFRFAISAFLIRAPPKPITGLFSPR